MMAFPKHKPERDQNYLDWLCRKKCCVCQRLGKAQLSQTVPSHVGKTGKGTAQKCSDYEAVPKCVEHHDQYHKKGRRIFEMMYGIDFEEMVLRYRTAYGV